MTSKLPLVVCALSLAVAIEGTSGATKARARSSNADQILQNLGRRLGGLQSFSCDAEVWEDFVMPDGQRIQATRDVTLDVRRPNKLHATLRSPLLDDEFWYDGSKLSLLKKNDKLYGRVAAPATIDKMVDFVSDKYGIEVPLLDLAVSDPYAKASQRIVSDIYAGKVNVLGTPCKTVLVRTENVDYQIWVEQGGQELPVKLMINYKHEDGQPDYTVLFRHWNTDAHLPRDRFTFVPPPGTSRISVAQNAG